MIQKQDNQLDIFQDYYLAAPFQQPLSIVYFAEVTRMTQRARGRKRKLELQLDAIVKAAQEPRKEARLTFSDEQEPVADLPRCESLPESVPTTNTPVSTGIELETKGKYMHETGLFM